MIRYRDILAVLEEAEKDLTFEEICERLPGEHFDYIKVSLKLEKLVERGQVSSFRDDRIWYRREVMA